MRTVELLMEYETGRLHRAHQPHPTADGVADGDHLTPQGSGVLS
jgi:hypothetical protein